MKTATVQELKQELLHKSSKELAELCLHLVRYKKDNKELLSYLLFESHDKEKTLEAIRAEMDMHFGEIAMQSNLYYAKKSLRKVLRIVNKYSRYIGDKHATASILIYYCRKLKESGISMDKSAAIEKIYTSQLKKIKLLIAGLHEDIQFDMERELDFDRALI